MKRSKLFAITLLSKSGLIYLFRPGSIQSAVGHISERLFCTITNAGDVLFAVCISDLIFRPENTDNAYAGGRACCPIFRHGNEYC